MRRHDHISVMMSAVLISTLWAPGALAQATSRLCIGTAGEQPGPACLIAHRSMGRLGGTEVYWHLRTYPDVAAARRDRPEDGVIAEAFGQVWLFTIGAKNDGPTRGIHVASVGPIAIESGTSYDAEFLKSTFSPGMKAPLHTHSGPEAFHAVSGDTCLETPDGVQFGRGPGNSLVVRRGAPMLLMAPGPEPRRGFALILHDKDEPPTTLTQHWMPKGLCQ